ncbi:MAG: TetR/AcrR family transcriptional regulator [Anaerolineales bacterium]|jgi:AcrR family transcriptional regulator
MNKENILEAAAQIIRQKGFHATSMQDIADAVSLQKASLYHHVSNKQEILLLLLEQGLDLLTARLMEVIQSDLPADDKIRHAVLAFFEILSEHSDIVSVLLLEYRSLDSEFQTRHIASRDRYENLWRELISEGVQSGLFRKCDSALTARSLLGVMNWTITWYRPSGPLSVTQITDHVTDLFLNGLYNKSGE